MSSVIGCSSPSCWILKRTGIRERHIVEPGVATSDLATEAALVAIREAGLTPDDIGFIVCPDNHGRFAADLLRTHISEKNVWMLEHHEIFQRVHLHGFNEQDDPNFINERQRWRGYKWYEWTAEFVERYDIVAIDPDKESLPLEFFEPMVERVFARSHEVD